jgi:hypothetical protein
MLELRSYTRHATHGLICWIETTKSAMVGKLCQAQPTSVKSAVAFKVANDSQRPMSNSASHDNGVLPRKSRGSSLSKSVSPRVGNQNADRHCDRGKHCGYGLDGRTVRISRSLVTAHMAKTYLSTGWSSRSHLLHLEERSKDCMNVSQ